MEKKIRLVSSPFGQVVIPVTGRMVVREAHWRFMIGVWLRSGPVEKLAAGALAGVMVFYGVGLFLVQLAEYGW